MTTLFRSLQSIPKSGSKKKAGDLREPHLFGRLRHIEAALVREIELLTKYERTLVFDAMMQARELIRDADARLASIDEHRRTKCPAQKKN